MRVKIDQRNQQVERDAAIAKAANTNTHYSHTDASVFSALDRLCENHPLPNLDLFQFAKFEEELSRLGPLASDRLKTNREKFLELIRPQVKASNDKSSEFTDKSVSSKKEVPNPLLLQHSSAGLVIWTEILTLRASLQKSNEQDKKAKIILARLIEIQEDLFKETVRLFLDELKKFNVAVQLPESEAAIEAFVLRKRNLFYGHGDYPVGRYDQGQVFREGEHQNRHIELHQVFILILHAIQFQEKFKSKYSSRLLKLFQRISAGRKEYGVEGEICNNGVRNRLVGYLLHRDYEGIFLFTDLKLDLENLYDGFFLDRLMQVEKKDPDLAFKIYMQWMVDPQTPGEDFDQFIHCWEELFQFLISQLEKMGIKTSQDEKGEFEDKNLQEIMKLIQEGHGYKDCLPHPSYAAALYRFTVLWKNRAITPLCIQKILANIKTFADTQNRALAVYYDFRILFEEAGKIYRLKDFHIPNPLLLGEEESSLKKCIEDIIEDFKKREQNPGENWASHSELVKRHQKNFDQFYSSIQVTKHIVDLIQNSFVHLAGIHHFEEQEKFISRVRKAFEEYHLDMNDPALAVWFKERENIESAEQVFSPYDINRIIWQALLTSPIKWTEQFKIILQSMLELIEKPFPGDQAHADVVKQYPLKLIQEIKWLIALSENSYIYSEPDSILFVGPELSDVSRIQTPEQFFSLLEQVSLEKRLLWLKSLYFPNDFFEGLSHFKILARLLAADQFLEACDWMLQGEQLTAKGRELSFNGILQSRLKESRFDFLKSIFGELNLLNLKKLFKATVLFQFNVISCINFFAYKDRVELLLFLEEKKCIYLNYLYSFIVLLKEIPREYIGDLLERKSEFSALFPENMEIKRDDFDLLSSTIFLIVPPDSWPSLFSKLKKEDIKKLFGVYVSCSIGAQFEGLSIDLRLPFLKSIMPHLESIYDTSLEIREQILNIFRRVQDFEGLSKEAFIELIGKQLGKIEHFYVEDLIEKYLPLLEKPDYFKLFYPYPKARWAKDFQSFSLFKVLPEEDWNQLDAIFNWKSEIRILLSYSRRPFYQELFSLPESIRKKALSFFALSKQKQLDDLAHILWVLGPKNWDDVLIWITGDNKWIRLFPSFESLINVVTLFTVFKKQQTNAQDYLNILLDKLKDGLKLICQWNEQITKLILISDQQNLWDLFLRTEDEIFGMLSYLGQNQEIELACQLIKSSSFLFKPSQLPKILRLFNSCFWPALCEAFGENLKWGCHERENLDSHFLILLFDALGQNFLSALEHVLKACFSHLNIIKELDYFAEKLGKIDGEMVNEVIVECLPFLSEAPTSIFREIKKFCQGDLLKFTTRLLKIELPEKVKRNFLREILISEKGDQFLKICSHYLNENAPNQWLLDPVFPIELTCDLLDFVSLNSEGMSKLFRAYELHYWDKLLQKLGWSNTLAAFKYFNEDPVRSVKIRDFLISHIDDYKIGSSLNPLASISSAEKLIPFCELREAKHIFAHIAREMDIREFSFSYEEAKEFISLFSKTAAAQSVTDRIFLDDLPFFENLYKAFVQDIQSYNVLEGKHVSAPFAVHRLSLLGSKLEQIFYFSDVLLTFYEYTSREDVRNFLQYFSSQRLMKLQYNFIEDRELFKQISALQDILRLQQDKLQYKKYFHFIDRAKFFFLENKGGLAGLSDEFWKLEKLWSREDSIYDRVMALIKPCAPNKINFFFSSIAKVADSMKKQIELLRVKNQNETQESVQELIQYLADCLDKLSDTDNTSSLALAIHFSITALSPVHSVYKKISAPGSNLKNNKPIRIVFLNCTTIFFKKISQFSLCFSDDKDKLEYAVEISFFDWQERNQIQDCDLLWLFDSGKIEGSTEKVRQIKCGELLIEFPPEAFRDFHFVLSTINEKCRSLQQRRNAEIQVSQEGSFNVEEVCDRMGLLK